MFGFKSHIKDDTKRVADAAAKAAFRNLGHAVASIAKDVRSTLQTAEGPSSAGQPPHTHKGAFLRRAVRYFFDKESAIVGPTESMVGDAGAAHEFGGEFRGVDYPERPFMHPALERAAPRFAEDWRSSIGD